MKILVVDDEQVMLDSIHRIFERETEFLIETARTGREAIDKVQTFHPDLVMMDIKMPGINGLEALTEIRRLDQHVVLVILSAYDNFNYAQEAIKIGVFEYLLKPINKTRIMEMIRKVQHHIEKRHFSQLEEFKIREKYQKSLPIIENELIHALIKGIDETACIEYQDLLGVQFQAGFFVAVSYLIEVDSIDVNLELQYQIRLKIDALAEEIHHLFPCFVSLIKTNSIVIFIPVPNYINDSNQEEVWKFQERYLLKITERLDTYKLPVKFRVGVGSVYPKSLEYRKSYQEALQALDSYTQSDICYFRDIKSHPQYCWEPEFEQDMEEILEGIRFGHLNRVEILCRNLSSKFAVKDGIERDRLLCYLLELILSAYRVSKNAVKCKDLSEHFSPGYQELIKMLNYTEIQDIFNEIKDRILVLTDAVRKSLQFNANSTILKAKDMIDHRYHQNLTLEEIARSVSISPFYFCRLFREELGVSFTEYLTKVRLVKAIDLLAQGLSVKECSFAVGYNDPNYFSRIFRKYYQVTPSEYRGDLLKKEQGDNENEN